MGGWAWLDEFPCLDAEDGELRASFHVLEFGIDGFRHDCSARETRIFFLSRERAWPVFPKVATHPFPFRIAFACVEQSNRSPCSNTQPHSMATFVNIGVTGGRGVRPATPFQVFGYRSVSRKRLCVFYNRLVRT